MPTDPSLATDSAAEAPPTAAASLPAANAAVEGLPVVDLAAAPTQEPLACEAAAEAPAADPPDWQARLAGETHLPPHLRSELAAALAQSADSTGALPLATLLNVLRETLPPALGVANGPLATPAHPAGEAFFRGQDEAREAAAEQIARAQLARCGLLKQPG